MILDDDYDSEERIGLNLFANRINYKALKYQIAANAKMWPLAIVWTPSWFLTRLIFPMLG